VWLNGGPGCSSMLGLFVEHGPKIVDGADSKNHYKNNDYSWNKNANVLYIESPAGVGFSKAAENDMKTNDLLQSKDLYTALSAWFDKFDDFKDNELYISGESYGGIYVPYLAYQVYQNNMQH